MRGFLQRLQSSKNLVPVVLLMLVAAVSASGQSSDVNFPTPVMSDSVTGSITPRDIGDARLTRHFYTFNASEGDLLITVESTNLNGDVDLFTAVTLRPLAKVTLYAGSSPTRATKSVYLRKSETLVLRIEGRTAVDTDATYTIRFAGAFAPSANVASPDVVAVPTLPSEGGDRNAQRASSVGARIDVPRIETPATETAESATPSETPADTPTESSETPATAATTKPKPRRRERVRQPPAKTARTRRTPDASEDTTAENSGAATSGEPTATNPSETPARTATPRRRNTRNRASTSRRNDTAASEASGSTATTQISTLLIIVNRDGTRIERDMSGVRRVTVENGMIVIVPRDGKIERLPMADVLRMTIEPQLQNAP